MIGDIIIGVLGNTAYDILKKFFKKHFGVDEDPILQLFIDSIKSTSSKFFHAYGDAYGTISSSFLSKENNWEILLKSIFYGAKEIDENSFDFITAFAVRGGALRYGWTLPTGKAGPGRDPKDVM